MHIINQDRLSRSNCFPNGPELLEGKIQLYLLLLRQFRSRFLARPEAAEPHVGSRSFARAPVQAPVNPLALAPPLVQIPELPTATPRSDRNRSQDEERLARLKMLSTRGKAPIQWQAVE